MESFTFIISSAKHGRFEVTAPARLREEIVAKRWFVKRDKVRTPGREFTVEAHTKTGKKRSHVTLHRFVWRLLGRPDVAAIDHVDRNPLNNAEDNLRDGTVGNQHNLGIRRTNTSGAKGVSWNKKSQRWRAYITAGRRQYHLGLFKNKQDAVVARDAAAVSLHGDFAFLNEARS